MTCSVFIFPPADQAAVVPLADEAFEDVTLGAEILEGLAEPDVTKALHLRTVQTSRPAAGSKALRCFAS